MKIWFFLAMLVALIVSRSGDDAQDSPATMQPVTATSEQTDEIGSEDNRAAERLDAVQSGLTNGPHDFSGRTGHAGDACSACHVPHVQTIQATRGGSGEAALQLYKMQGQREVYIPDQYMPGPTSLICLSCHNGTVADSTIGTSHALLAGMREGFAVPDGFVWRDHPIGVPYPEHDREYRPKNFIESEGAIPLPEGRIECISCHDPHGESGVDKLLVMSNRRSALCLSCHVK